MPDVNRRLPPLNQLRAFEAAARHLSFKGAAEELNVTHTAVSHQVRALEDFLGVQLFQRVTRGVRLTDEARELSDDLKHAFDSMDIAVKRFKSGELTGSVRVSVVPWYGNRLIVPNLPDFHTANPGLTIDLGFSYELVDFSCSDFHAALRHGHGNWDGLDGFQVHSDIVSPLCAPELVAGQKLPLSADEIARMDLAIAHGQEATFRAWLIEAGASPDIEHNFILFDNRALATEYALGGNGVCLPDLQAMQLELKSGQFVRLHPMAMKLESGLHLIYPDTRYPDPRLRLLADWLKPILSVQSVADEIASTQSQMADI